MLAEDCSLHILVNSKSTFEADNKSIPGTNPIIALPATIPLICRRSIIIGRYFQNPINSRTMTERNPIIASPESIPLSYKLFTMMGGLVLVGVWDVI
jgi:hypothetical protein